MFFKFIDWQTCIKIFSFEKYLLLLIYKTALELEGRTVYQRSAFREMAPNVTDCLTSIHYIFKKALSIDIPITYVGDMPRNLFFSSNWKALKINIEDALCGDILFVKNKERIKLLSHAALILGNNQFFHCSPILNTAAIQSKDDFFSFYEQKLNLIKMLHYIDPRNKEMREKNQGIFIVDEISI